MFAKSHQHCKSPKQRATTVPTGHSITCRVLQMALSIACVCIQGTEGWQPLCPKALLSLVRHGRTHAPDAPPPAAPPGSWPSVPCGDVTMGHGRAWAGVWETGVVHGARHDAQRCPLPPPRARGRARTRQAALNAKPAVRSAQIGLDPWDWMKVREGGGGGVLPACDS